VEAAGAGAPGGVAKDLREERLFPREILCCAGDGGQPSPAQLRMTWFQAFGLSMSVGCQSPPVGRNALR